MCHPGGSGPGAGRGRPQQAWGGGAAAHANGQRARPPTHPEAPRLSISSSVDVIKMLFWRHNLCICPTFTFPCVTWVFILEPIQRMWSSETASSLWVCDLKPVSFPYVVEELCVSVERVPLSVDEYLLTLKSKLEIRIKYSAEQNCSPKKLLTFFFDLAHKSSTNNNSPPPIWRLLATSAV